MTPRQQILNRLSGWLFIASALVAIFLIGHWNWRVGVAAFSAFLLFLSFAFWRASKKEQQ